MNTRHPEAPKTRVTFTLPSPGVLRRLDQAHEQGFRRFLRDIGHNARNLAHRRRASEALVTLMKGLSGEGPPPDYDGDHYVAAAYMVKYHLSHCMMAFWAFKLLFDRVGVPRTLYVCDVGAGTGAARVGLTLALSKPNEAPSTVYFSAVEPSGWMRDAGSAFWQAWRADTDFIYWEDDARPERAPDIQDDVLRVMTAFHLSLPFDNRPWDSVGEESKRNIQSALRLVSPHVGLFTAHRRENPSYSSKVESLKKALDRFARRADEFPIPEKIRVRRPSPFYTACAEGLGFKMPEDSRWPVCTWSPYRFSPPSGVLLLQDNRAEQEEREQRERQAEEERREQAAREEQERQQRAMAPSSPAGPAGMLGHRAKAKRQAAARAELQRRQQAAARAEAERRQQERERRERAAREEDKTASTSNTDMETWLQARRAARAEAERRRQERERRAQAEVERQAAVRAKEKRQRRGALGRLSTALKSLLRKL